MTSYGKAACWEDGLESMDLYIYRDVGRNMIPGGRDGNGMISPNSFCGQKEG
jgi:hypothetical protein